MSEAVKEKDSLAVDRLAILPRETRYVKEVLPRYVRKSKLRGKKSTNDIL